MNLRVERRVRSMTRRAPQVLEVPSGDETVRIVCISDTHGRHETLDVPPGDILVHAGDFTAGFDPFKERREVEAFNEWLESLPHPHKIVIAGNHDLFMRRSGARKFIKAAHYLENESTEVMGLVFFGSPFTPRCGNGAFHFSRLQTPKRVWSQIPDDVDVLVTHGPPRGILDENHEGVAVGDADLRARVDALGPRLHVFGHAHESYGQWLSGVTAFVNAAAGPPIVTDVQARFRPHELRAAKA